MKILSIESSATSASVAVCDNKKLLCEFYTNVGLTHSQTIMPMVENSLKIADIDINSIDIFAVSYGPGSFTGIRIGISSIKGMADALKKPCFAVSTLETIAYPFIDFNGVVISVMDARCNQVYTASFENGKRLCSDDAILIDELSDRIKNYKKDVILCGDGAEMCYNILKEKNDGLFLAPVTNRFQKASSVAFLAEEKLLSFEKTVSASELLPLYLRLPQAERELKLKENKK
ncbi:MAG: tRNA (adenosine(37)-N6)-threonylcarbamoyltransferase complex dimerization subunit type 1 TsaB [Oscillospiraceae bacterium]